MQKTANDQVFSQSCSFLLGFIVSKTKFAYSKGKRHKSGWRNASFLVPVFVEPLQAVGPIQFHRALCAPPAYIPVPAVRRNKCR